MEIRATTDEDQTVFLDTFHAALGRFTDPADEEGCGAWWSALELDRGLLALTPEGKPVGTATVYGFELTLPGGPVVPAPGVTGVGVLPTHRRQGILTAMMRRQLADLRAGGNFLAVLLASEAGIYGRFGYGPATYTRRLTVPTHRAAFRSPTTDPGTVELFRRADCGELLEQVYDRYRRAQPGALSRPPRWWARGAGQPPISGAERYVAVHRDAEGTPDGYASYTLNDSETLSIDETITADDAAFTALAKFALGHDLVTEVIFRHFPTGHPLRWQFADFMAAQPSNEGEWLWVRLLDVPRALAARGWFADGELVLDVDDPFLAEHHRYLLTVRNGTAECVPTDQAPDLSLDIRDLGAIYLGGTEPTTLTRAGHLTAHTPDAAARADTLFRANRPPHCVHWF